MRYSFCFIFLFAVLFSFSKPSFSQTFPMTGQTWLFLNGPNEDTHIVRSVSDFAPSSAIMVRFNEDGTADMRFSNLSGRFMRSTTEAIDTLTLDLHRNVLRNVDVFQVSEQPFPDTSYSCDEALYKLSTTLRYSHYEINGQTTTPTSDSREWKWFFEPPECHVSRAANAEDRRDKDLCQSGWCSNPTDDPNAKFQEACNESFTECRQSIEEGDLKVRPSSRKFWNLHIYPKIVLHPRHPATGRIQKEVSLTEEEAQAKRAEAIDNPNNELLKPYLNSVLDDSASVYFSGQFLWPEEGPYGVWSIRMDVGAEGQGATGFYHDPPAAYRLTSFTDWLGLQKALLLPFTRSADETAFLTNLNTRCPGWSGKDRRIGVRAFSIQAGLDVTLPDVLPTETTDPAWTRIRQERVEVNGGYEVRTIVEEDRVLTDQKALVRNVDFPYGDYFWKGCPDEEDTYFKRTKTQLARILALPVPTCNLKTLGVASELYGQIASRFKNSNEASERTLALKRAQEAEFYLARTKDKERPTDIPCPDSPLDVLLRGMGAP